MPVRFRLRAPDSNPIQSKAGQTRQLQSAPNQHANSPTLFHEESIVDDKLYGSMILDAGLEKLTNVEPKVLNQLADRS